MVIVGGRGYKGGQTVMGNNTIKKLSDKQTNKLATVTADDKLLLSTRLLVGV